jgi:MFS family permease
MLMSFGMFGSIFLLAQFFQVVQHYSPLGAGLRTLPWTIMPIFVAPVAGLLSARTGTRPLLFLGMSLMAIALAWMSLVTTPTVDYLVLVPSFILAGAGMGLFFAPIANVVLSAVRPEEEGKASGANNAIRELGGVFGVAVLASVFATYGSYVSGQTFVDGLVPAMRVGAIVVAFGAVAALALGGRVRTAESTAEAGEEDEPFGELGAAVA